MHPILFKFGPITIYSYGFALFIAVLVSLNLLVREAKRSGYNADIIFDLGIVILFSGILGARILYVLLNLGFYIENPKEIFMLNHGGLAILGGVIASNIAAFIFIKSKKLHFLNTVDLIIPYVALGESIGRIGCFFNGCCYGLPSKFGIYFPVHDAVLIPTQLITSFSLLILFIALRNMQIKRQIAGKVFVNYILCYSAIRFFIEFIRADSQRLFLNLTIFQYFCIILFISAIGLFIFIKRKSGKEKF